MEVLKRTYGHCVAPDVMTFNPVTGKSKCMTHDRICPVVTHKDSKCTWLKVLVQCNRWLTQFQFDVKSSVALALVLQSAQVFVLQWQDWSVIGPTFQSQIKLEN